LAALIWIKAAPAEAAYASLIGASYQADADRR